MKILVRDLLPNPFRDLTRYPIDPEKIECLKTSIDLTTFWDNLLARSSPTQPGKYELAYGVHRRQALLDLKTTEIDIPIRDLSDADMMKIMAHENMQEWTHSAEIDQETVRAVVLAYAQGKIELPAVRARRGADGGTARYAPSFKIGEITVLPQGKTAYTAGTIAKFLGWKPYKVDGALAALANIEEDLATEDTFKGLSSKQAETVAEQTRRIKRATNKPALARRVGERLAAGMRQTVRGYDRKGRERNIQDVTIHNARQKADEMAQADLPRQPRRELPPLSDFARDLIDIVASFLPDLPPGAPLPNSMRRMQKGQELQQKLQAIIDYREDLPDKDARDLIYSLRALAKRLNVLADKLERPLSTERQKLPHPEDWMDIGERGPAQ